MGWKEPDTAADAEDDDDNDEDNDEDLTDSIVFLPWMMLRVGGMALNMVDRCAMGSILIPQTLM